MLERLKDTILFSDCFSFCIVFSFSYFLNFEKAASLSLSLSACVYVHIYMLRHHCIQQLHLNKKFELHC